MLFRSVIALLKEGKAFAAQATREPEAEQPFHYTEPTATHEVVGSWFSPNFLRSYPFKVFLKGAALDAYAASNP